MIENPERFLAALGDIHFNSTVDEEGSKTTDDIDLEPETAVHPGAHILTGRYDVNVAPITAYRMAQVIPHAQFHVFEQSGHNAFYEEPEAYRKTLTDFLNGR